ARYDNDPSSGRVYNIDDWTLDYMGVIEGLQPTYPGSNPIWANIARGFQKGAADPAATRQGLAAETMRSVETARLTRLFEDQRLRIMSDYEVIELLKTRGMDVEYLNPRNSPALDAALMNEGIVTQGYIARLAESRALDFADQMTYSGEVGSQAGRRGRAIWRFGQAYGDMFARWGRMLFSRAMLRPWLGKTALGAKLQRLLDFVPINPKVGAALSRWSARDLESTGGLIGESETEFDFSPMTCLPTRSGGFHTLIPGLGPSPVVLMDLAVSVLGPDPAEDPQGYQDLLDNLSQIVPAMAFHGRDWYTRFTGSGNIGFLLNATTSFARGVLHNPNYQGWRFTGDVRSELLHSRQVNVVFSDPQRIEEILSAAHPEQVELLILAGLRDADLAAAGATLSQTVGSWAIPVRGALDTNMDQLYKPWVSSARRHLDFFDLELPSDDALQADQQLLLRIGDDIRRQFFNLEPWQRQLILATSPELAANMVQVWQWSPSAPRNLPGRDMAYRTVGSSPDDMSLSASLERHSIYVNRGWVIPRDSYLKPYDIIGTHLAARNDITEHVYTVVAKQMNDIRWDNFVSENTKRMLDALIQDPRLQDLGVTTGRELWEMWSSQRDRIREDLATSLGLDPKDPDVMERVNKIIKVPEAEEAWSTLWRGDNMENWSDRTLDAPAFINEEAQLILERLGIEAESGMAGRDFVAALVDYRFQHKAAWNA